MSRRASSIIALLENAVPAIEAAGTNPGHRESRSVAGAVLRQIVVDGGSPAVGVCLDTANSLGAGEGLSEVARELAAMTVNMHVKDVAISRLPHMIGFLVEGRPSAAASCRFARRSRSFAPGGRCRSVLLESWVPPEADMNATRRVEASWATDGVGV